MYDVVFLNPRDSVATTTRAFEAGEELQVDGRAVRLLQAIPFAHKVAVKPIPQGQPVYKYGEPIGLATADIAEGELVHTHNLKSNRGLG